MNPLKSVLINYKWKLISFVLGVGLAGLLIVGVVLNQRASDSHRLLRWTIDKRLAMVDEVVKEKKVDVAKVDTEFEDIQSEIDAVRVEKEAIGKAVDTKSLQELSKIWKKIGH